MLFYLWVAGSSVGGKGQEIYAYKLKLMLFYLWVACSSVMGKDKKGIWIKAHALLAMSGWKVM